MQAPTHVAVAGLAIYGSSTLGLLAASPAIYALAALGSLLPDIDHPGSWVGRRLKLISYPIRWIFGHRGITHSLIAALALLVALRTLGASSWVTPLVIGYLSHLAADWLTPAGVPLLYPSRRTFRSPMPIKTGGAVEIGVMCLGGILLMRQVMLAQ